MSDWYDVTSAPGTSAALSSATIRAEFALIALHMGQLPALTGNANKILAVNSGGSAVEALATVAITQGGTGAATAADARTNLGLDTMAVQAANAVAITGGTIVGITDLAIADGGTGASTASDARDNLGITIGTDIQAQGDVLDDLNTLGVNAADSEFLVGTAAGALAWESGSTVRTSLGLGSMALQASTGVSITGGTIVGITDLTVADGGTGSSTASDARTALGLEIGTDVQTQNAFLQTIATAGEVALADMADLADERIVGRVSGTGIPEALTKTQVLAMLNVEDGADVTDTANVEAAGALMDSEVDADIQTLALPANTTISVFGASLIDDAAAINARTTLGLVIDTDVQGYTSVLAATTASYTTALNTKLGNIETLADVTDAANVADAGAVMESDATTALMSFVIDEDSFGSDLDTKVPTQQSVKAFIAAQVSGALVYSGGYDATANSPDLDVSPSAGISANDFYIVTVAGTFFTIPVNIGDQLICNTSTPTVEGHWDIIQPSLTDAQIKTQYENNADTNEFSDAEQTSLATMEDNADVTDTDNVTSAGALMDSEVDVDIKTLVLPASTTISTFGASLVDDAAAINGRATLGLTIGTHVQAWTAVLDATTASFLTADETKLDAIEPLADVTDADNVNTAGAVMVADTSTSGMGFVLDEDAMGSDSNTKLATQQSIRAYVDGAIQTSEGISDVAGAMWTGNTEVGVSVTYEDGDNTMDITVTGVLQDLNTLGAPTADSEFLVATGAGVFAYETAGTARTSLGLGSMATQAANSVAITGGSVTGITDIAVVDGGTGSSTQSGARSNLGLGSIATQASNSVSITGGSVTGITDLAVADGGTGSSTAANARTALGLVISTDVQAQSAALTDLSNAGVVGGGNQFLASTGAGVVQWESASTARGSLGLGTIATQASNSVSITGGNIQGVTLASADIDSAGGLITTDIGVSVQAFGAGLDDLVTVGAVPGDSRFLVGVSAGVLAWETAATARTSLGLVIGTNVQAYDAGLLSIAGLTTAANKMIYTTGSDTYAVTDLSALARTILADTTGAAIMTEIGALPLAGGTWSGAMVGADQILSAVTLKDFGETEYAHGSLSSATDMDLTDGNVQSFTVGGAFTLSITNPVATGDAQWLALRITNGSSSTITWPASVDWGVDGLPTFQAADVDWVVMVTTDAGTTWEAKVGWAAA